MSAACILAKKGYYGANIQNILDAPVSHILHLLDYEQFLSEYENTDYVLNSKE